MMHYQYICHMSTKLFRKEGIHLMWEDLCEVEGGFNLICEGKGSIVSPSLYKIKSPVYVKWIP